MGDRASARKAAKATAKNPSGSMKPKDEMNKAQKAVIHWVRRNVPTKTTKFLHSHKVEYFSGAAAVTALVTDSPWAKGKADEKAEIKFEYREQAVEFMDDMLKHKMFHRAKKIPVQDRKAKKAKKAGKEGTDTDAKDTPKPDKAADKKKRGRKIRLDMHLDQLFMDSQDAYVWLYDPIPWYYWLGGTAIVLGIIAICLFPLWPPMMRLGVHYLSIAAAGFLCFIIGLGVFKYILFAALFAFTAGKLKFWLFPNLTEDVGFIESFLPVYDYTYTGKSWRKAKDSDDEEEDDDEDEDESEGDKKGEGSQADRSESDESESRKSSTGKDFEMVDKTDTDYGQDEED